MKQTLIFVVGVAAGSVATWLLLKEKYERYANEQIDLVIDYYLDKKDGEEPVKPTKEDKQEYDKIASDSGYKSKNKGKGEIRYENGAPVYYEESDDDSPVTVDDMIYFDEEEYIEPYIISAEDIDNETYEQFHYTYYADFVLADEEGEIVPNSEEILGNTLDDFGDKEVLYVRNEELGCEYEIIKHDETFSEINGS